MVCIGEVAYNEGKDGHDAACPGSDSVLAIFPEVIDVLNLFHLYLNLSLIHI